MKLAVAFNERIIGEINALVVLFLSSIVETLRRRDNPAFSVNNNCIIELPAVLGVLAVLCQIYD